MKYSSHRIKVLGREINVKTSVDVDTVRKIELFVNSRLAEVKGTGQPCDNQLSAILALMNIAEDFLALEKRIEATCRQESDRVLRLIQLLDSGV